MRLSTILFEDHTAENFRPLSWSRPVYEIPCGLHTLRERVAALLGRSRAAAAQPRSLGLLPRRHLEALHGPGDPAAGRAVGPAACRELSLEAERVLWLAGRLGPRWDLPAELLALAEAGRDFAWSDDDGLLACCCAGAPAAGLLDGWEAWRGAAEAAGCWSVENRAPSAWRPEQAAALPELTPGTGVASVSPVPIALRHLWDPLPALGAIIVGDLTEIVPTGAAIGREPFGIVPDPAAGAELGGGAAAPEWIGQPRAFRTMGDEAAGVHPSAVLLAPEAVWAADGAEVGPLTAIDARRGPVILDRGVRVGALAFLEGPLYLGPGCQVKPGARIGPEVVAGGACRLAGEVAEAMICDFSNKQHDGFLGHAVLGSWVNLGAGTTCSDLKNNYGPVRVDLGLGEKGTGLRFLGPLIGDHVKTAIGTVLNTGAVVGFASNVFGAGFPPKRLPAFTWGADPGRRYDARLAVATARIVLARRGVRFGPEQEELFRFLAAVSAGG